MKSIRNHWKAALAGVLALGSSAHASMVEGNIVDLGTDPAKFGAVAITGEKGNGLLFYSDGQTKGFEPITGSGETFEFLASAPGSFQFSAYAPQAIELTVNQKDGIKNVFTCSDGGCSGVAAIYASSDVFLTLSQPGKGVYAFEGKYVPLTPVPAPDALSSMAGGLALLRILARRRRQNDNSGTAPAPA